VVAKHHPLASCYTALSIYYYSCIVCNEFSLKRTQVLVTFQHYHVTQHLVVHNSVGNKTKSIRPRLRPRPKLQDQDQDQNYKTCKTKASLRPVLS